MCFVGLNFPRDGPCSFDGCCLFVFAEEETGLGPGSQGRRGQGKNTTKSSTFSFKNQNKQRDFLAIDFSTKKLYFFIAQNCFYFFAKNASNWGYFNELEYKIFSPEAIFYFQTIILKLRFSNYLKLLVFA